MAGLDQLETLFVIWAFFLQIVLIIHFAIRKPLYDSYTLKFGWLVYALCFPSAVISLVILFGGKSWSFWLGGFLFIAFAAYGYWIDYVKQINWRKPLRKDIMFPYVTLYLGTIMFYWWPLGLLSRPLWIAFGILFLIGSVLNLTSH
ncbi:MAG: hypothetical protein P8Y37_11425 [Anaerolineales bacterium]